ncbi:MAG TPA: transcription termination factor NusA [Solirubrobacterales bacterium]|nr:transcription termination factor NusA [Solirubrobacterales bacterium]HMU27367.1 transcription termination factor NusA [Solirubrobacterales bacterium]HMY25522.1 transcription termination factor NusA [Solirubrobacterales bacterium]HNA23053.1 transcription termination factor NusA [Solirubrobacterales bacterium]HNA44614.1 transcription termination factor NusA [Solirubrobacterales bacterium]
MTQEIVDAVRALEQEKGIAADTLMDALADALLSAYRKSPGSAKYAEVDLDHETGDFRVFELILPAELEEKLLEEAAAEQERTINPETGEYNEPEEPELDPEMLDPYRDQIERNDVTPDDFGRIAAQTAKQVIYQRIREAERQMMYEEYRDRVGELITGLIQQSDKRYTLVQLRERVEALLPKSEQVYSERYDHGMRVKAVITDVSESTKGPSIVVSRRSPELIKGLFELEVPEIADKLVEIVGVAREPGYRSKIAVVSHADGVDPVGACVGPRGSRVRMVVSELRGEKIDIIPYNEEPARFVAKALSPARVREVLVDDEDMQATVVVPDDQLSLAIGRDGQNARLAARLTGWRVDIKSESEFAREESEHDYEGEEEFDGRCMAVLSSGRRCPNAAVSGSTYCQLPQHQALSRFSTSHVGVLASLSDEDVSVLADPDADEAAVNAIVTAAEADFVEPTDEDAGEEQVAEIEEAEAETTANEMLVEEAEADLESDDEAAAEVVAEEEAGEELAAAEEAEAEAELEEAEEAEAEEAEEAEASPEPVDEAEEADQEVAAADEAAEATEGEAE